jgi:hypothetical protein
MTCQDRYWVHPFASCPRTLSSRKRGAGIQSYAFSIAFGLIKEWMPAFAGMTRKETGALLLDQLL